jgi:hypothetical protein
LLWLILSYLALNFLTVVRPFPIGWDDLGSYLNRPRLLVSYEHFIFSMSTFQWEYLTSIGFLLFGYDTVFGATASMLINWSAGLIAVFAIFAMTNHFLGPRTGILSALLYYTMPLVGHFSFADMKIDNAVFAMGALSMLAGLLALFPSTEDEGKTRHAVRLLFLAGLFGGFAFSMKVTAIMVFLAIGPIIMGVMLNAFAFVASFFFVLAILAHQNALNVPQIIETIVDTPIHSARAWFYAIVLCLGFAFLASALLRARRRLLPSFQGMAVFLAAFLMAVLPWIMHNNILADQSPFRLTLIAPNTISPIMDYSLRAAPDDHDPRLRILPPELALDPNHPACKPTGKKEELDRYWGYDGGWSRYLTLPWRSVMNIDSGGYYVTPIPALLLFPLLLLLPYFWSTQGRWFRWLWIGTSFITVQWMFTSNGVAPSQII